MIILDTHVVSELLRAEPAPMVEAWLASQDGSGIYLTAMSEAELLSVWTAECGDDELRREGRMIAYEL